MGAVFEVDCQRIEGFGRQAAKLSALGVAEINAGQDLVRVMQELRAELRVLLRPVDNV